MNELSTQTKLFDDVPLIIEQACQRVRTTFIELGKHGLANLT